MSTAPLARDADLSRVLDDGYDVVIQGGHLVIRHIPYVTSAKQIAYGFLAYPVAVSGDHIVSETDHRIWFGGEQPCNEHGQPLSLANPEQRGIADGVQASFMLSSKPGPTGYPDQYSKITAYVRILSHSALALDPSVSATPGAAWQEVDDDQPFRYRDTASSRAGLAAVNKVFRGHRIAVVGVGGTGGYILDQIAKTPVDSILIADGDTFENHNAFRAPGVADLETLKSRPKKVDYFADLYSRMHTNITALAEYIGEDNVAVLEGTTFAFLATDDPVTKKIVVDWLTARQIPYIDVGMGIEETDGKLAGLLRMTAGIPGRDSYGQMPGRIPGPAHDRDDYSRNIQTADLNALNALLAVVRWKRHLGFYADVTSEAFATYSIITNEIANEDLE